MFVLTSANLIAKLIFELELSTFFNVLELHAFEHTVVFVRHELGFKKLSDQFEGRGIGFSAQRDKLVAVVFCETTYRTTQALTLLRALASCRLVGLQPFKAFP
jgi:hypothetical protein